MASVVEKFVISLGLDVESLQSSLGNATAQMSEADRKVIASSENVKKSLQDIDTNAQKNIKQVKKSTKELKNEVNETSKAFNTLSSNGLARVKALALGFAAPIAAVVGVATSIKGYFSDAGEVARMTGQYSTVLEDWRKKRAMLNRVTQEDIELYKKSRESLTKFNIVMADLGSFITRQQAPAIKMLLDWLDKLSSWIDRNKQNIARFITVVASTISVLLVPALYKMAVAMLANPITWIVAGITALIVVIDDLVTYMHGGKSVFGDFWADVIPIVETLINFVKKLYEFIKSTGAIEASINSVKSAFSGIVGVIGMVANMIRFLFNLFTGDFKGMQDATDAFWARFEQVFNAIVTIISNVQNVFINAFTSILELFGVSTEKAQQFGDSFRKMFSIENVIAKAKSAVASLIDWLPDFLKTDDMQAWAQKTAQMSEQVNSSSSVTNSNSSNVTNTNTQNNNITINTNSNDPKAVANAVNNGINQNNNSYNQMTNAYNNGQYM